jgi:hypothetical protein
MKPKYDVLRYMWQIPEECWAETSKGSWADVGFLFETEKKAEKAIKIFEKIGKITPVDVWELL